MCYCFKVVYKTHYIRYAYCLDYFLGRGTCLTVLRGFTNQGGELLNIFYRWFTNQRSTLHLRRGRLVVLVFLTCGIWPNARVQTQANTSGTCHEFKSPFVFPFPSFWKSIESHHSSVPSKWNTLQVVCIHKPPVGFFSFPWFSPSPGFQLLNETGWTSYSSIRIGNVMCHISRGIAARMTFGCWLTARSGAVNGCTWTD